VLGRLVGTAPQELGFRLAPAGTSMATAGRSPHEHGDARARVPRRAYLIFGPASPPGEVAIDDYIAAGGGVAFDIDGTRNPTRRPAMGGAGGRRGRGRAR